MARAALCCLPGYLWACPCCGAFRKPSSKPWRCLSNAQPAVAKTVGPTAGGFFASVPSPAPLHWPVLANYRPGWPFIKPRPGLGLLGLPVGPLAHLEAYPLHTALPVKVETAAGLRFCVTATVGEITRNVLPTAQPFAGPWRRRSPTIACWHRYLAGYQTSCCPHWHNTATEGERARNCGMTTVHINVAWSSWQVYLSERRTSFGAHAEQARPNKS